MQCTFWYATHIMMLGALFGELPNILFGTEILAPNTSFGASETVQHTTHVIAVHVNFSASRNVLFQVYFIRCSVSLCTTFIPYSLLQGSVYSLLICTLLI